MVTPHAAQVVDVRVIAAELGAGEGNGGALFLAFHGVYLPGEQITGAFIGRGAHLKLRKGAFTAVERIHQPPLPFLPAGHGAHAPVFLHADGSVFTGQGCGLQHQTALAQQLTAIRQADQLVEHAQRIHAATIGGVVQHIGNQRTQLAVTHGSDANHGGIPAAAGGRIIGGRDLEAFAQGTHIQRHALPVDILARILVGQPQVTRRAVLVVGQLQQARRGACDGRFLEGIAGVAPGFILPHALGALGAQGIEALGPGRAVVQPAQDTQILHHASQLLLAHAHGI